VTPSLAPSGSSVHEGELKSGDGLRLYFRERLLADARAQIVLVHGLAEHGGRYGAFEEFFAHHRIGVSVMDLRGHGRSEGRRVWVPSFETYLEDLDLFLARVLSLSPRVFLVGHSLGGLIATRHAETRPVRLGGLILSGAALEPAITPPAPVTWVLRRLNALSSATPVPGLIGPEQLSRDPAVVQAYRDDPLIPRHLTTGLGLASLEAGRRALAEAHRIQVPTLVLHGGADPVVDPRGSEELHARLEVADRELKVYPGLRHEIFNEPERGRVLADVVEWVGARAAPAGPRGDGKAGSQGP
jgi:alpha-beta hydrolase superfamily lysophospholipase